MRLIADLKTLWHLSFKPIHGGTQRERLENFYSGQAGNYDDSRREMLAGREELYRLLSEKPSDLIWLDMGGGTGAAFEPIADRLSVMRSITIVDLANPLLDVARRRIENNRWNRMVAVQGDMSTFCPPNGPADIVTFAYSLTMASDWRASIDHAFDILRPGGMVGVIDFYVSAKHPASGLRRHSAWTRHFWPACFGLRDVHPSEGHLPYLRQKFGTDFLREGSARAMFMLGMRVPIYCWVGRKPIEARPMERG